MRNRVCFASVDVERDLGNIDKILSILQNYGAAATLFVTGDLLQKYPDKFRKLAFSYEIACHSFTHRFWDNLSREEREKELDDFIDLYRNIFNEKPQGFRSPSHIIDKGALEILEEKEFLYDSSMVPHYPPLKKYRGYKNRAPLMPYYPTGRRILEIPVRGQIFGIPLAGAWITKLPWMLYKILFFIYSPPFVTLSIHSWDSLKNFEKIIKLLRSKNYQFLNGKQIHQNYR